MNDEPITPESEGVRSIAADPGTAVNADPEAATRASTRPFNPSTPIDDPAAAADCAAGTLIGKYRIIEPIRGGGMGYVYRAFNPDLKCDVAIKVIRAGELARPDELRRFALECEALARFRHPHIVAVHDASQHRGRPFLVMEYLPGGSLTTNAHRYQSDARLAVALMEKVARAVEHLHAGGMLHRDLKPANVLLDEAGEPHVSDFGLVKLLDNGDDLTRTGHHPGTPPYMAPEQTEFSSAPLGPATNVWSLGIMLYELLLGRRPFAAEHRSSLFRRIATQEPDRPRVLRPGFDAALEAVLLKCLEKNPARRFATAGELADELARWLKGEKVKTPTRRHVVARLQRAIRRRPRLALAMATRGSGRHPRPCRFLAPRDTERSIERIEEALAAGQAITVIADAGPPAWFNVLHGNDDIQTATDKDGFFIVKSNRRTLVRLVRTAPRQGYRFRVKIRDDGTQLIGRIGVFWGHHAKNTNFGKFEFYYQALFNDFIDQNALYKPANAQRPIKNSVQFNAMLYAAKVGNFEPRHFNGATRSIAHFQATQFAGGRWRRPGYHRRTQGDPGPVRPGTRGQLRAGRRTTRHARGLRQTVWSSRP